MAFDPRRSVAVLMGAILLLPPLGLVLLWLRERPGLLGKLAASLGIAAWSVVYLYLFAGMRFQASGTGLPTLVSLLWSFAWETSNDINVAQPVVVDESHVFVSAGYGHGAALVELIADGDGFDARAVWQNVNMKNKFTSSVLHEGHLYGLDEAILACIDAKTGERKWKGGRYGYGQILLASDHILVLTEGGDLALVRATPERFDEVARLPAIEGKTWNHPALADGILLVRNLREMAAFDLRRN